MSMSFLPTPPPPSRPTNQRKTPHQSKKILYVKWDDDKFPKKKKNFFKKPQRGMNEWYKQPKSKYRNNQKPQK